jgi:defect-in-organelle-trafficking protein DotB
VLDELSTLFPTVDGKRTALREYLIFNEEVRDILLESDPDDVTAVTRRLLKEKGQPMLVDAEKKFKAGIISEREYKVLAANEGYNDLNS